jgi:hypothetical protein
MPPHTLLLYLRTHAGVTQGGMCGAVAVKLFSGRAYGGGQRTACYHTTVVVVAAQAGEICQRKPHLDLAATVDVL